MPKTPGEKYELVMECQQSTFSSSSEASDVVLNVHVHYPGLYTLFCSLRKLRLTDHTSLTYIHFWITYSTFFSRVI